MAYLGTKPANQITDSTLIADGTVTPADLSTGAPSWSASGGVTLPRIDSSNEGGQLNFNRASDNTATWSIDSFGNTSTPSLRFIDGANVRAVIDGIGNVGIGTSSPTSIAGYKSLTVNGTTSGLLSVQVNGTDAGYLYADSTSFNIDSKATTPNLLFRTNGSERMRITSGGNVLVGTTSGVGAGLVGINAGTGEGLSITNSTGATRFPVAFLQGTTYVGSISTTGSSTAYNTSSDYRLKENIEPMQDALGVVAQLKPVTYNWKIDGSKGQGFIAHELQAVVPDCVTGEKDAVETYIDEEGNEQTRPKYQGVDTSFLVATLTAAIQELKAELDSVKAELNTLKNPPVEGTE